LRLKSRRPVRRTIRALDVTKKLCIHVNRQLAEVDDFSKTAADRYHPWRVTELELLTDGLQPRFQNGQFPINRLPFR